MDFGGGVVIGGSGSSMSVQVSLLLNTRFPILFTEANQVTMVRTSQSGEHLEPLPVLQLEEGQPNKGNAGADVRYLILRKHETSHAQMQRF